MPEGYFTEYMTWMWLNITFSRLVFRLNVGSLLLQLINIIRTSIYDISTRGGTNGRMKNIYMFQIPEDEFKTKLLNWTTLGVKQLSYHNNLYSCTWVLSLTKPMCGLSSILLFLIWKMIRERKIDVNVCQNITFFPSLSPPSPGAMAKHYSTNKINITHDSSLI